MGFPDLITQSCLSWKHASEKLKWHGYTVLCPSFPRHGHRGFANGHSTTRSIQNPAKSWVMRHFHTWSGLIWIKNNKYECWRTKNWTAATQSLKISIWRGQRPGLGPALPHFRFGERRSNPLIWIGIYFLVFTFLCLRSPGSMSCPARMKPWIVDNIFSTSILGRVLDTDSTRPSLHHAAWQS